MTTAAKPPVLIVDDDHAICDTLRYLLEDEGYEALWTGDGAAALNILRSAGGRFVVLLDYLMPGVSGQDILETVALDHDLSARHAIILMTATAHTLPARMRQLLSSLAIPVIQKPFDIDELAGMVAEAAARLHSRDRRGDSNPRVPASPRR